MPGYLVRIRQTKDLVGFYGAEEIHDLERTVDELCDPSICEYTELPAGGIMWTRRAIAVPLDTAQRRGSFYDNEDSYQKLPWAEAKLSEIWWSVVHGYENLDWIGFSDE